MEGNSFLEFPAARFICHGIHVDYYQKGIRSLRERKKSARAMVSSAAIAK
jgi:hypothetical protein